MKNKIQFAIRSLLLLSLPALLLMSCQKETDELTGDGSGAASLQASTSPCTYEGTFSLLQANASRIPLEDLIVEGEKTSDNSIYFQEITDGSLVNNFCNTLPVEEVRIRFYYQQLAGQYTVADWQAGIDVTDLVALIAHINGTQPFTSFREFLAADANGDGAINVQDVIVIQSLIVQNQVRFATLGACNPINQPVLVVQESVYDQFNAQSNFGADKLIETYDLNCLIAGGNGQPVTIDGVGVKRGDVNGSWTP